jgi:DNA-directed RNA polymerase specialized sigma24 family protein
MSLTQKRTDEFIALYDEMADQLFRHCFFKLSNRELALDLVQETFSRTWEYISSGKEVNNIKGFLFKVANNLIIDEYRKKKLYLSKLSRNKAASMHLRRITKRLCSMPK